MISGIIMAAGYSKRYKEDKLLKPIEGISCVERVIKSAMASNLDEIILVYRKQEIKEIADKYGVKSLYNENAHLGQSASMQLGIHNCHQDTMGYLFMVGDQPFINSHVINAVINKYKDNDYSIIIPTYDGQRGNPTLFSSTLKEELLKITGDMGGRGLIASLGEKVGYLKVADSHLGMDMDTEEDYKRIIKLLKD